jgi:hypothetical protein
MVVFFEECLSVLPAATGLVTAQGKLAEQPLRPAARADARTARTGLAAVRGAV